nr:RNA-directed DNA polymerase, eukaryota [Tanacetum cinerariifolium]
MTKKTQGHAGKAYWVQAKEVSGWVLIFVKQDNEKSDSDDEHSEGELNGDILRSNEDLKWDNKKDVGEEANRSDDMKSALERVISKEEGTESVCSSHFKKSETPRSGGSILSLMDELVKKGEVIVMRDFNEVRNTNERFGSVFNVKGVNAFNSFISSAGLEEVPLEVDGFEKLVNETWSEAPVDMSNAMLNLMKKLKYLKKKIRAWNNDMRKYSKNSKLTFKAELENLDSIIDKGEGNDDIINKRMAVVKLIQELDKL